MRQPLSYTLTVPQSVPLQVPSRNSKALEQDVYRKSAALAQANEGGLQLWQVVDSMAAQATALSSPIIISTHVTSPAH